MLTGFFEGFGVLIAIRGFTARVELPQFVLCVALVLVGVAIVGWGCALSP